MVNTLPSYLVGVIEKGLWRHPGTSLMNEILPEMEHPIKFLQSKMEMNELHGLMFEDEVKSEIFREYRSSKVNISYDLPWLDLDEALFIIVNTPEYDSAIALDFRLSFNDPRVVYSKWNERRTQCQWIEIASNFEKLCDMLNINQGDVPD